MNFRGKWENVGKVVYQNGPYAKSLFALVLHFRPIEKLFVVCNMHSLQVILAFEHTIGKLSIGRIMIKQRCFFQFSSDEFAISSKRAPIAFCIFDVFFAQGLCNIAIFYIVLNHFSGIKCYIKSIFVLYLPEMLITLHIMKVYARRMFYQLQLIAGKL